MKINTIVVHCSDSPFGCSREIDKWHRARGWSGIGYHFVVLNGFPVSGFNLPELDGSIECGRYLDGDAWISGNENGAHTLGLNDRSIGICLIGVKDFTASQMAALIRLCGGLVSKYGLASDAVIGHNETASGKAEGKTCPNFDVAVIRAAVREDIGE